MIALKWNRPVGRAVTSKCGRFRIENFSDSYQKSWPLFDHGKIVKCKSSDRSRQFDRLKDAKAHARRIVHHEEVAEVAKVVAFYEVSDLVNLGPITFTEQGEENSYFTLADGSLGFIKIGG